MVRVMDRQALALQVRAFSMIGLMRGQVTMSDAGERTCPLCAEEMDLTDQQLKPCKCGYDICVWCWHHIMDMSEKDNTEGRCPACRTPYNKEKIVGTASKCERLVTGMNIEKKQKSQKGKTKTAEARKELGNVRVIQRNLVYIVRLPINLADEDLLQQKEYFGQYGKVLKVSISRTASGEIQQFPNNTCSVYITYSKEEEAVRSIQSAHGFILEGRPDPCFICSYLALYWVPTRADGKSGQPVVSICNNPVAPGFPVASKVGVKALSLYSYSGEGIYFGGYEGSSIFSWFRENMEGTIVPINGATSKIYEVTDADYNCRLMFGYTPVRSDSVVGELKMSEPTDVILPELPRIEMLALTGKAVEGEVLTAIEVIPKSDAQQNVWKKYKKHVRYQWYISSETGNSHFEPIQSQCSCSYKLQFNDIGYRFKCECVVIDTFGRSSEPAYSETAPVSPGIPRIEKMEIEGRGFHTNLYEVRGNYSGGKEGKSKIQWLRSMVGSPDLISIPGETGRMYEANVDDVGYRLVAIYTPIREDGVEGHPVSASTEPITVEPDVLKEVIPMKRIRVGTLRRKENEAGGLV